MRIYHYQTYTQLISDGRGNSYLTTRTEKVVTYRESEKFKFFSWRDVSRTLTLDTKSAKKSKKPYIKLELDLNFELADVITKYDFAMQKNSLLERNRHRDTHIQLTEKALLDGFNKFNLIKVSDSEPCCINIYVFSILVLFALVIFYDLYIAYFCIYQDFIVKKLISSRYNLNSPEFDEKYLKYLPRILYNDDEVLYNEAPKPATDKTPELLLKMSSSKRPDL
jgi:hypothetical protein